MNNVVSIPAKPRWLEGHPWPSSMAVKAMCEVDADFYVVTPSGAFTRASWMGEEDAYTVWLIISIIQMAHSDDIARAIKAVVFGGEGRDVTLHFDAMLLEEVGAGWPSDEEIRVGMGERQHKVRCLVRECEA